MFGKYKFAREGRDVLSNKFNYNPSWKDNLPQVRTWTHCVDGFYRNNGKPVEAAIMFMMAQINVLYEDRDGPFVRNVFRVINELRHEMTPEGRQQLSIWFSEFAAETEGLRQNLPQPPSGKMTGALTAE